MSRLQKKFTATGDTQPHIFLDGCFLELGEPGRFTAAHPWCRRSFLRSWLASARLWQGTAQVGGRAQATSICSTIGGISLSCANYPCALGGRKHKLLLKKPSPSFPCSAQGSALHWVGGRAAGSRADGDSTCQQCWMPDDSFPAAATGKAALCACANGTHLGSKTAETGVWKKRGPGLVPDTFSHPEEKSCRCPKVCK